ncbi:hypothetical protein ACO0LC_23240 [Undibacterium sp. JH2W]|uniref:hypothetical protein n=1 Tax=Undibacterium sp. JH2W TaxID=3413037 RepID=UPI003BF1DC54
MPTAKFGLFIQNCLDRVLAAGELDTCVQRARALGELLWKNDMGQYALPALEQALLQRYQHVFKIPAPRDIKATYLHVLSQAYTSSGHTRVVEHLIASQALQDSAVLVTEKAPPATLGKLSPPSQPCICLPKFSSKQEKIQVLLEHFASYKILVLHIHPYDIEAVIAAGLARQLCGTRIYMYNHADHVFSYGHGMADVVLELSYYGWELSKLRGSHEKCVFAGIPLKLPDNRDERPENSAGHIASAGSAYKFKPGGNYSFPDFAIDLQARTGRKLMLIGPNLKTNWWWWKPARQMGKQAIFHQRMAYQDYLLCMRDASVYVDSFPLTGGTAFPEMAVKGLPCFGILTGAHGYSPADQFKSGSQAALLEDMVYYLGQKPEQKQQQHQRRPGIDQAAILQEIREVHGIEQVASRISQAEMASTQEKQPPWHNPAPINCNFYEKIWYTRKLFTPPIHNFPDWKLGVLFLKYWIQSRQLSRPLSNQT